MKVVLSKLSLDSVEINALTFDCDINGGSDSPTPVPQDVPAGQDSELYCDLRVISIKCHL